MFKGMGVTTKNAPDLTAGLKLLADPVRLRILALLSGEDVVELSVGELTRALALSQSRVSNQLRHLREAGLLAERHQGTSCHLRLAKNGSAGLFGRLWETLDGELEHLPEHAADRQRLARVLAERDTSGRAFFDRLADEWDYRAGDFETGGGRTRALLGLFPRSGVFADIGCGTGYMSRPLLGVAEKLILVDNSTGMLEEARRRLDPERRGTELEFCQGASDALPLEDNILDGAIAGLLLHHVEDLDRALGELFRVLKPGGTAAVLELLPHREDWMRAALGDRHLGLEPRDVMSAMTRAGFVDVGLDDVDDSYRPGPETELSLFFVRGVVPHAAT
jgi:SAM-dependent methyltransferase